MSITSTPKAAKARSATWRTRQSMLAICLAALGLQVGCNNSTATYPHAQLAGSVAVSGEAVSQGRIHFMPNAGTPGVPVTAEISAGRYLAKDVPIGNVTVTFSAVKETGNLIREANRQPYPEMVSIVPPKYAQGVPLAVTGDNDAQNFALDDK